jgi:hypothetical protein
MASIRSGRVRLALRMIRGGRIPQYLNYLDAKRGYVNRFTNVRAFFSHFIPNWRPVSEVRQILT